MTSGVLAPVAGTAVGLAAVPDPVFAEAMVGPGTAIEPVRAAGIAVAPVTGLIVKLHPHALVVADADEHAILVHLGIDTVKLHGEGFELRAAEGEQVSAGQPLVRWNPAEVEAAGYSPICPVVALDISADALCRVREEGDVAIGDELFVWA